MKIRPLHDRLVVKRKEFDHTSPGGIVIPDKAAEKPTRGEVIAVGTGKILNNGELKSLDVKIGDEVLFGEYSGTEIKFHGEKFLVLRQDDVMGIFEK